MHGVIEGVWIVGPDAPRHTEIGSDDALRVRILEHLDRRAEREPSFAKTLNSWACKVRGITKAIWDLDPLDAEGFYASVCKIVRWHLRQVFKDCRLPKDPLAPSFSLLDGRLEVALARPECGKVIVSIRAPNCAEFVVTWTNPMPSLPQFAESAKEYALNMLDWMMERLVVARRQICHPNPEDSIRGLPCPVVPRATHPARKARPLHPKHSSKKQTKKRTIKK